MRKFTLRSLYLSPKGVPRCVNTTSGLPNVLALLKKLREYWEIRFVSLNRVQTYIALGKTLRGKYSCTVP
jgi:hypothetical protein